LDRPTQIIKSAQVLFAQFGLKKVTTDDIAKEAQVSKATVYKYFKNKFEIFDQVIEREANSLLTAIEDAVAAETSTADKLQAHLKMRLSNRSEFINFYRVTQESRADYWPFIVRIRRQFLDKEQRTVARIIKDGVASGELEVENPERAALVLVLALASVEYQWSLDESRFTLPKLIDLMLKMMLNGIRKREMNISDSNKINGKRELLKLDTTMVEHYSNGPHKFHIPVMGTGFTIDTPLRVAKYGISSVISIGDDSLMEQVRKFYLEKSGRSYNPIPVGEEDCREKRTRSYLNLINELVEIQMQSIRSEAFEPGNDITRYFEMLPDGSLKDTYSKMLNSKDSKTKMELQSALRHQVVTGHIDVNIMTKVDQEQYHNNIKGPPESGLAMAALRGFATSKLRSSVVLSAGINKRLFAHMAKFEDFFPSNEGPPKKTIILKVSDYRSAMLQGKLFVRHGLWISEFRIESGLNCGGHAFANVGELMGPILEEFKNKRTSLEEMLRKKYYDALAKLGKKPWGQPSISLSAQGGVGTLEEHKFLVNHYGLDSVGWGTPFLMVPQVTNVGEENLKKLISAKQEDVVLSDASPLGVPFWKLRTSASDEIRRKRIRDGVPGSPCPKRYLSSDFEFSRTPICKASSRYQKLKLDQISKSSLPEKIKKAKIDEVLSKTCLCSDLAAGVLTCLGIDSHSNLAICCGPGIVDFKKVATLREMVDHIYGRLSLICNPDRPHMFIKELSLYITFLQSQLDKAEIGIVKLSEKYFADFSQNLLGGIEYYRELASHLNGSGSSRFLTALKTFEDQIMQMKCNPSVSLQPSVA